MHVLIFVVNDQNTMNIIFWNISAGFHNFLSFTAIIKSLGKKYSKYFN